MTAVPPWSLITAIAVTVDIVALRGAAGMSEACGSGVGSSTTKHDGGPSGTTANSKQPEEGIIRIININKMMKMIV